MRYAMIMAGGAGTRLWPLSRAERPKQLVPLIERGGRRVSLLQLAADRLEGLVPHERRYICASDSYRNQIKRDLSGFTDSQILGEPAGRDTLNAVGFGAAILQHMDPDAIFAVLTADQLIEPEDIFRQRMDAAYRLVEEDPNRFVTFAITPTFPATGYGYVEKGEPIAGHDDAFRVQRFVEKPDLDTAKEYLSAGTFGWNSGMFVWRASTVMREIQRLKPRTHEGLVRIADAWGGPRITRVLEEVYPGLEKISVDYGLMEPVARDSAAGGTDVTICTVAMDIDWMDVGSWPSLAQTMEADETGCRKSGPAQLLDCRDTLVFNESEDHHVALLGCVDMIVVHTPEATLVMPRDRAEDLKKLHARLPENLR